MAFLVTVIARDLGDISIIETVLMFLFSCFPDLGDVGPKGVRLGGIGLRSISGILAYGEAGLSMFSSPSTCFLPFFPSSLKSF